MSYIQRACAEKEIVIQFSQARCAEFSLIQVFALKDIFVILCF